jgi:hypothetical protein
MNMDDEYHGNLTFWIVSHATTRGIVKAENCRVSESSDGKAHYAARGRYGQADYLFEAIGRNAFNNEEDAKKRAKVLITNKIAGLDKQKAKLKKLLDTL